MKYFLSLLFAVTLSLSSQSQQIADRLFRPYNTLTDTVSVGLITVDTTIGTLHPQLRSVRKSLLKWNASQIVDLQPTVASYGYITNTTLADSTEALRNAIANIELLEGPQGPKGDKGDAGEQGIQGPKGDKGDKGDTGDSGIVTLTTTGTGAATYNSETKTLNIPTPALVAQYGTTYTKEWNGKATTGTGTNEYTFNISAAGFSSISNIQVSGYYNGATTTTAPLVAVKTYSTTSVTVVVAESANTGVLLGGNIEGLTDFLKNNGEIFITVKGN